MIDPGNRTTLDPVSRLVLELARLPGIGERTAARLAHFLLRQDERFCRDLAESIVRAKVGTRLCSSCFSFTDADPCRICASTTRTDAQLCVVERPQDITALESLGSFRGKFHVLHGALSPLEGIGPEDLKIRELLDRVRAAPNAGLEIILATNPSVEGEATAMYLARLLRPLDVRVTQLAHGLPVGGLLEYTDRQTLDKALSNRQELA